MEKEKKEEKKRICAVCDNIIPDADIEKGFYAIDGEEYLCYKHMYLVGRRKTVEK